MTRTAAATPSAGKSWGTRMRPTQPTPRYANATSQRGASIHTRFRTMPKAAPSQTVTSPTTRAGPVNATSANGRVRAGDEDEDHRVVEPTCAEARRRAPPREAVIQRARPEHRRESDGVHPDGEALEIPVGEDDEQRPRDDGRDERVLVEDAAQARHVDVRHRPMMPDRCYACGIRASRAAARASRTGSSSTRSSTSWKKPRTIRRSASARVRPRVIR